MDNLIINGIFISEQIQNYNLKAKELMNRMFQVQYKLDTN